MAGVELWLLYPGHPAEAAYEQAEAEALDDLFAAIDDASQIFDDAVDDADDAYSTAEAAAWNDFITTEEAAWQAYLGAWTAIDADLADTVADLEEVDDTDARAAWVAAEAAAWADYLDALAFDPANPEPQERITDPPGVGLQAGGGDSPLQAPGPRRQGESLEVDGEEGSQYMESYAGDGPDDAGEIETLAVEEYDAEEEEEEQPPTSANLSWDHFPKVDGPKPTDARTSWIYDNGYMVAFANVKGGMKGNEFVITGNATITNPIFKAVFNKDGSWIVNGKESPALLKHEQLHLRIAEYIVQKAQANVPVMTAMIQVSAANKNAALAKFKVEAAKEMAKQMKEFMGKLGAINDAIQTAYDRETKHGTDATTQADWEAKYKQFADAIMKDMGWMK